MKKLNEIVITEITGVMTVFSRQGKVKTMNNRSSYGLSFCREGQITYTHKGNKYVSDSAHAIILPKGQNYSISGNKDGLFPVINFECAEFLCDTMMVLPVENIEPVMRDFLQMKNLILFKRNRAKVMSLFYNIIHKLCEPMNASGKGILLPAVKHLENNYSSPELTNRILAEQCNISEVYFRKLFTELYGITPKQYIIDIRIDKAKQLLTDGIMTISAVGEKCGFSNPYHFSRLFKERTGLTPTQYLMENRI